MRRGSGNTAFIGLVAMLVALAALGWLLFDIQEQPAGGGDGQNETLFVYCAAGTRPAIQEIVDQYKAEFGVTIEIQYQGSNTLLSQIEIASTGKANAGDVYIAADDSYIDQAIQKGLVRESIAVARQRPVIVVQKGNPKGITGIDDLLNKDVITALGNPDQAAVGKVTRKLLKATSQWDQLEAHVREHGVFKPTVPEIANDVKLGTADAAITWDATLNNYPELEGIRVPALDAGTANISVGILTSTEQSARALHFARYISAPEKGQTILAKRGFEGTPGDPWADKPTLTFFCGAVNRAAVQPVLDAFEVREGVQLDVSYNGCGFLTGTMKTIQDQDTERGFPDTYMACDVYYLDVVQEWFEAGINVSDTSIVIAVPKGNPRNIRELSDLAKPGMRVAVGQPQQCTIGVLTKKLFAAEGLTDSIEPNIVAQKVSSAQLIPDVAAGAVDAVLAYATDTRAAADRVDAIEIESQAAIAIQPFSVARTSRNKLLASRLFKAIAESQSSFEAAGFHWRLNTEAAP